MQAVQSVEYVLGFGCEIEVTRSVVLTTVRPSAFMFVAMPGRSVERAYPGPIAYGARALSVHSELMRSCMLSVLRWSTASGEGSTVTVSSLVMRSFFETAWRRPATHATGPRTSACVAVLGVTVPPCLATSAVRPDSAACRRPR